MEIWIKFIYCVTRKLGAWLTIGGLVTDVKMYFL